MWTHSSWNHHWWCRLCREIGTSSLNIVSKLPCFKSEAISSNSSSSVVSLSVTILLASSTSAWWSYRMCSNCLFLGMLFMISSGGAYLLQKEQLLMLLCIYTSQNLDWTNVSTDHSILVCFPPFQVYWYDTHVIKLAWELCSSAGNVIGAWTTLPTICFWLNSVCPQTGKACTTISTNRGAISISSQNLRFNTSGCLWMASCWDSSLTGTTYMMYLRNMVSNWQLSPCLEHDFDHVQAFFTKFQHKTNNQNCEGTWVSSKVRHSSLFDSERKVGREVCNAILSVSVAAILRTSFYCPDKCWHKDQCHLAETSCCVKTHNIIQIYSFSFSWMKSEYMLTKSNGKLLMTTVSEIPIHYRSQLSPPCFDALQPEKREEIKMKIIVGLAKTRCPCYVYM